MWITACQVPGHPLTNGLASRACQCTARVSNRWARRAATNGADLVTVSLVDLAELAAVEPDEDLFALMPAHCPYCATPLR